MREKFAWRAASLVLALLASCTAAQAYSGTCYETVNTITGTVTDSVANYTVSGNCPPVPPAGGPGTEGVCLGSIDAAISCAQTFYMNAAGASSPEVTYNYTITVGAGTMARPLVIDLTRDTSLLMMGTPPNWLPNTPGFSISNLLNAPTPGYGCTTVPQSGCLTIQGNGGTSAYTTITTAPGKGMQGIYINSSSHIMFQHLTMRQPAETMTQGTFVSQGTVSLTIGGSTATFNTVTLDILQPATPTPIIDAADFAVIASGGTRYTNGSQELTLSPTDGSCTQPAILQVEVTGGSVSSIDYVAQPAICTTHPNPAGPIGVTSGNATFYVAYLPTPMAQWIASASTQYPGPYAQFTGFMKAYTNAPNPVSVPSTETISGSVVQNEIEWGSSRLGSTYAPQPPTRVAGHPHRWTLTFAQQQSLNPVPTYFTDPSNILCMHKDSANAFFVIDLAGGANAGTDVVFSDMVWINEGRGVFRGVTGAQVLGSSFVRDGTTYAGGQYPCFAVQSGGLQFSQPGDPATYGNLVDNFTATATGDDSVAMFNDVGGTAMPGGGTYPQSRITNSTITNADQHPIRLYNNYSITNLYDYPGSPPLDTSKLDVGNCATPLPLNHSGSPVCVDSATSSVISSTPANCDTDYWNQTYAGGWGLGCPFYYNYDGYTGRFD